MCRHGARDREQTTFHDRVGVEGTGAYGAGLPRYLQSCGLVVIEVHRPCHAPGRHVFRYRNRANVGGPGISAGIPLALLRSARASCRCMPHSSQASERAGSGLACTRRARRNPSDTQQAPAAQKTAGPFPCVRATCGLISPNAPFACPANGCPSVHIPGRTPKRPPVQNRTPKV